MVKKLMLSLLAATIISSSMLVPARAQGTYPVPGDMDRLVDRIALYPDPLLAQVLTASTYWDQIPEAAGWANQHRYLNGDALARAIADDRLPWDTSVLALIPIPGVLDMMSADMGWTQALGNAVLNARGAVMDSVQHLRQRALEYGYLRNTPEYRVVSNGPGDIEILPAQPGYILVPRYDPMIVYAPPRRGFFAGGAISFGPRIYLGAAFAPWGWSGPGFGWRSHTILIDRRPWERTWTNRNQYVHPYSSPRPHYEGPRVERHEREHDRPRERGREEREHDRR